MGNKNPELITLKQECIHFVDDAKAFLVLSDWDKKVWIPKSLCTRWEIFDEENPRTIEFMVQYWFAKKEGLI